MDSELRNRVVALFEETFKVFDALPPSQRKALEEYELVFVHVVNGRHKPERVFAVADLIRALEDGGKPVGLIIGHWLDVDKMTVKEFPNLTVAEQVALHAAFAEYQDESKERFTDE